MHTHKYREKQLIQRAYRRGTITVLGTERERERNREGGKKESDRKSKTEPKRERVKGKERVMIERWRRVLVIPSKCWLLAALES